MPDDTDTIQPEVEADEETVGYGRPPKRTQFKPGRSGNARGRPPGAKGRRGIVQRVLGEVHTLVEGGRQVARTTLEFIVRTLRNRALEGDARAFKMVDDLHKSVTPPEIEQPRGFIIVPEALTDDEWDAQYHPEEAERKAAAARVQATREAEAASGAKPDGATGRSGVRR